MGWLIGRGLCVEWCLGGFRLEVFDYGVVLKGIFFFGNIFLVNFWLILFLGFFRKWDEIAVSVFGI